MKTHQYALLFHVLIAGFLLSSLSSWVPSARAETNLSGTWQRDPESSDDADAKIEETAKDFFDKATKGGRGIMSDEIREIQKNLERIISLYVHYAEEMVIEDEGTELVVDDGYGKVRIFYVDGLKHKRETPFGAKLETICTRQGGRIVIEQKLDKWGRITETYLPSSDGEALIHTVRFESKRFKKPLVIRNSYFRIRK
jgi:hypothetical protein